MKLSHIISRSPSYTPEVVSLRSHVPWIASPLELEKDHASSGHHSLHEQPKNASGQLHTVDSGHHFLHDSDSPHFRHRHESSTIELFYDLFFVANLATFTANHEIVDAHSLKNYVGFFTILWFTWLQTSLFDVRFATDSVFNRVCKATSFGVMTGFAITGAIYDTTNVSENLKAFRALSIILMVSRLLMVIQYGVVLFFIKGYKRTWVPMLSTMAILFVTAFVYLGTFFAYKEGEVGDSYPNQSGGHSTYIAYYVLAVVEAIVVIIISCVWRVVSFKRTHLVERVGLLTLIIMGEGIIGMSKSVSQIIKNSATISSSDIGVIICAVLLIYFIWVLYFDQIENDRFGTIRQQIWAVLHYPLHVAIVLTVEGSTFLILWNIIVQLSNEWDEPWTPFLEGNITDYYNFSSFDSSEAVVEAVKKIIEDFGANFKGESFEKQFNSTEPLTELANLGKEVQFTSDEWKANASDILDTIYVEVSNSIFKNFGVEPPEKKGRAASSGDPYDASSDESDDLFNVFQTVYTYFPIAAGVFLFLLAILFWFGKTHKSRAEWASIAVRAVAGIGLSMMALVYYAGPYDSSVGFVYGPWAVVTVMLAFLVVIVLDNLLVSFDSLCLFMNLDRP